MSTSILLLFAGGVILTLGDIAMKKWVVEHCTTYYALGMALYICAMAFLAQSFKYENIAVASALFVIFNIVTLLIASSLLFGETISSMKMLGIALAIMAIAVLELS